MHDVTQLGPASRVLDMMQIPAFLCRQTDLVYGAAKTGCPVNVKKGQFMAPEDMKNVIEKMEEAGNTNLAVTERGVPSDTITWLWICVPSRSCASSDTR